MELEGRHALITGTTSGIGRQLALDLLERGMRVTSIDRNKQETGNPSWISLEADVREPGQVEACFKQVKDPIHILINNAGVMRRDSLFDSPPDEFDLLVDTNLKGPWLVLKYALPVLAPGAIIMQMASRHALTLPKNPALYGLSKRWVMDMMEVVAKTYPQFTVKVLCPGPVDTALARIDTTPAEFSKKKKWMCTPAELSRQILALLKSKKSRLRFDMSTSTYVLE